MRRPRRRLGAREGGAGRVCGPYVVWGATGSFFVSVSSSSSAASAARILRALLRQLNGPENAHWFFPPRRTVAWCLSAPKTRTSHFRCRRARGNLERFGDRFFSFSHARRRFSSADETIQKKKKTGALYDVCNSDALSLLEQETFDRVYSLVR